uniref:Uncharacterized protein n=1 Tax=Anguilla anguilla TaxID=7936 RepID=A0A0E9TPA5_ANGAN
MADQLTEEQIAEFKVGILALRPRTATVPSPPRSWAQ